jgi:hypothetical protein
MTKKIAQMKKKATQKGSNQVGLQIFYILRSLAIQLAITGALADWAHSQSVSRKPTPMRFE